jgi:DNA-binding CsgD family transcriptional regulator
MSAFAVHEVRRAFAVLNTLAEAGGGSDAFVRQAVRLLPALVRCESAAIAVCDLDAGCRTLCADAACEGRLSAPVALGRRGVGRRPPCAVFGGPCALLASIVDARAAPPPRCGALRPGEAGAEAGVAAHALALPLSSGRRVRVSVVLARRDPPFDARERALLALLRPQIAALYRLARAAGDAARPEVPQAPRDSAPQAPRDSAPRRGAAGERGLTGRELEVVEWLRAGKTNSDIAAIVGASRRTVEKHLEHIYQKLGVETRTAAVMRLERSRPMPR